jgi:hypothetical protein
MLYTFLICTARATCPIHVTPWLDEAENSDYNLITSGLLHYPVAHSLWGQSPSVYVLQEPMFYTYTKQAERLLDTDGITRDFEYKIHICNPVYLWLDDVDRSNTFYFYLEMKGTSIYLHNIYICLSAVFRYQILEKNI